MKKLVSILFSLMCLLLFSCSPQEQTGLIIGPPPSGGGGTDKPDNPDDPGDPGTPEDPYNPSRLGQTPIIAVYFTEYTSSSEFPTLEDVRCFTHINAGHVRFVNKKTGDGGLEIDAPGPDYMRRLAAYKTSYPELKLLLFIGGWGKNADGFSEMAKDPDKRALFCSECVRLCEEYNFDGVDLDWEYPTVSADKGKNGYEGTGADPSDRQNFSTLMKELRAALGESKIISYAAASDDGGGSYVDAAEVLQWVDYINVMTYSMGDPNPSDPSKQKHNSPLYTSSRFNNSRGGADCIEKFHTRQGIPYNRMNYGVGFYGHGDDNIYPSSVTYANAREALEKGTVKGKSVAGYNKRWWDDESKSCYLGDNLGVMYASYEDVESIGWRVKYIKEKGLLGAFAWEYREDDSEGTLRKALHELMMDGVVPPDPTPGPDLGASGTANCYVITAPGTYKFKTVQGNSTTSVGTVAKAEVLWETSEGMIQDVVYGADYIYVTTPETIKPGNALIAAKNSYGTILWSWHIWIPKTQIDAQMYDLSWYKMMDRNLGALEAASASAGPDSYGLLYQWGRKDPFLCKNAETKNGGTMTIAQSIASPTTFADNAGTWMTSADKSVWGDGGTKSIYDPCPPGYKVPQREDVTLIFRTDDISGEKGWQYSSGKAFALGDPSVWFPYAGYLDVSGNYVEAGSQTKIWNSHMDTANDQGYGIFVTGSTSNRSSQKAARGGSIRCISDEQQPFTNEPGMPVQGSYTRKVFDAGVVELSGLCLSKDKDFLWGVGDQGEIYKFTNIDGSVESIAYSSIWTYETDMEGITIDPDSNPSTLYLGIEADRVYRVLSPYTAKTTIFEIPEATNMGNSGVEGITWHKGDLYVGSQSGATLWCYTLSGTQKWKKQLGSIAPGIEEVGDLCYDSETDLLWVADSEAHKLFVFDGDVTKLKAVYDVSYIGNAESVSVDHSRNCVWVGDDGSTSKIYKIAFTGL